MDVYCILTIVPETATTAPPHSRRTEGPDRPQESGGGLHTDPAAHQAGLSHAAKKLAAEDQRNLSGRRYREEFHEGPDLRALRESGLPWSRRVRSGSRLAALLRQARERPDHSGGGDDRGPDPSPNGLQSDPQSRRGAPPSQSRVA